MDELPVSGCGGDATIWGI